MDILSFVLGYNKGKAQGGGNAPAGTDIFPLQTVEGFTQNTEDFGGAYIATTTETITLTEGETYYVEWDGTTYTCVAKSGTMNSNAIMYLGNDTLLGGTSDEPFTVAYFVANGMVGFLTTDTEPSHDIRVYQKAESSVEVKPLTITANGTYTAPDGEAYSPVTVAVAAGVVGELLPGYELIEILPRTELTFKLGVSEAYPFNPVAVIADEEGKETMDVLQNGDNGLVFWGKNNEMYAVATGAKESPAMMIGGIEQPLTFQNLSGNTGAVHVWGILGSKIARTNEAGGSFEPFLISTDKDYVIAADGSPNVLSLSRRICMNSLTQPYSQLEDYFASPVCTGLQKLNVDQTYYLNWDRTFYTCQAKSGILTETETGASIDAIYIGNGTVLGQADTGEPFTIICYATDRTEANFIVVALDAADRTPTDSLGTAVMVEWAQIWTYEEFTLPVQIYKIKQKKYAVNFYDDDTVTLLNTVQVGHGNSYTYTPTKEGYIFKGWSPEPTNVTAPMNCYAQWEKEPVNIAKSSWADIKAVVDEGKASETFSLGDTRTVTFTYEDGTTEDIDFELVDFAYMADNSYSSGRMAFIAKQCLKTPHRWHSEKKYYSLNSELYLYVGDTLVSCMPTDLQNVMYKALVPNLCADSSRTKKMYIPSKNMFFGSIGSGKFTHFGSTTTFPCTTKDGTTREYWVDQSAEIGKVVTTKGALSTNTLYVTTKYYIRPVFFI